MHSQNENLFLAALALAEFESLQPHLRPYDLTVGKALHYCGDHVDQVIFPHSGLVVRTMRSQGATGTAVLTIGRDGIVGGFEASASVPALCDAKVHVAGKAWRMPASAFRDALDQNPGIREIAACFSNALLAQAQQTALCNAVHQVGARVCRWLLEIHDRSGSNKIPLAHNTLAEMLGVRRTTVTLVVGDLKKAGAVDCGRGFLRIQNRDILDRNSCQCYRQLKNHLRKMSEIVCAEPVPKVIQPTAPHVQRLRESFV